LTAQVDESMKFTEGGIDRIAAIATLDKPAWTIVASIDTEPYIASPRRTGIFTLAATGLFVLVAGALIALLVTRVQRRTAQLQEANEQLEEQNRLVQEANAEIAQATENKSKFLRRMSHDLRSPMNAIIGFTRILRRRLADRINEREARNLANIETSSGNLLNLINAILDLGRIEAGHIEVNLQPVDVRQLANECADALESIVKEGVELSREMADVGEVNTDADRLREIVMNLLGNATKFTEAGSITLSLRRDEGGKIELSIADTGIGIPPDDLPHIFEEFRQVERQGKKATEGTGLGLAIAKKTVGLLGGEITANQ
jgi:signal transduction histidine kinase